MEERFINEEIKKGLINKQINILNDIYDFCDANNLKISLAYGTLLGAVRHKGYIPWDHDIDCMMPRKDYDYFCRNYKNNNGLFLQTNLTDRNFKWSFAKVRDSNTTFIEPYNKKDMNQGIWVDIFPMDNVGSTQMLISLQYALVKLKIKIMNPLNQQDKKRLMAEKIFGHPLVLNILNHLGSSLGTDKRLYADFSENMEYATAHFEHLFDDFIYLDFEGNQYQCIANYDNYLTKLYGDYMKLPSSDELYNEIDGLSKCIIDPEKSYLNYVNH